MAAMRITLARLLVSPPATFGTASKSLILLCDFDESGYLVGVRTEVESNNPALLAWVRQALNKISTPKALLGRAFILDLVFELGD